MERVTYCNFPLPLPQPLVPEFTPVAEKLFIVCQPAAVPERILRDAFSRFGGLIDVYLLPGTFFYFYAFTSQPARSGRVAQSVTGLATGACLTADPGIVSLFLARFQTFVEIDHEIV